ncbi:uncharacterized protein LOC107717860 [Tachysurus ichikawai]
MEVDQNGNKESSSLQNTPTKVMPKKQRGDAGLEISSASSSGNLGCQHKLDDVMDTVYRVGPKRKIQTRQLIHRFLVRKYRDEFWCSSKFSDTCKDRGIKFAPGFIQERPRGSCSRGRKHTTAVLYRRRLDR